MNKQEANTKSYIEEAIGTASEFSVFSMASIPFWAQRFLPPEEAHHHPLIPILSFNLHYDSSRHVPAFWHVDQYVHGPGESGLSLEEKCKVGEIVKTGMFDGQFGQRTRVVTIGAMAGIEAASHNHLSSRDFMRTLLVTTTVLKIDDLIDSNSRISAGELAFLYDRGLLKKHPDPAINEVGLLLQAVEEEFTDIENECPEYAGETTLFIYDSLKALSYGEQLAAEKGNNYTLSEAVKFRNSSNSPFMRLLFLAAGGYRMPGNRIDVGLKFASYITNFVQLYDDIPDVFEDAKFQQPNLVRGALNSLKKRLFPKECIG